MKKAEENFSLALRFYKYDTTFIGYYSMWFCCPICLAFYLTKFANKEHSKQPFTNQGTLRTQISNSDNFSYNKKGAFNT